MPFLIIRFVTVLLICMSYRLGPSVCALPANLDNDFGAVDVDSINDVLDENKLLISFVVSG